MSKPEKPAPAGDLPPTAKDVREFFTDVKTKMEQYTQVSSVAPAVSAAVTVYADGSSYVMFSCLPGKKSELLYRSVFQSIRDHIQSRLGVGNELPPSSNSKLH